MGVSRRALLAAAAASASAAPAGSAPAAGGAAGRTTGRAAPTAADWRALDSVLAGTVYRPGTAGYDDHRRLNDPRFDGVRPPAVVRCAVARDVPEAVRFARRFGLRVVPRGGGHSYVGASTATDGLVLDTRPLAGVRYDPASGSAIIGAAARLIDVYEQLGRHGVSVPAGSCGTVGIGGLTLGGGIGMASSAYGLTCDTVLSADLVTADGRYRTVDAAREPDLFWALRGGGGGAGIGVVTAWRMRTFRISTVGSFVLNFPWRDAERVAAGWQRRLATMPDSAWSTLQFSSDARGGLSVRVGGFVLAGDPDTEIDAIVAAIGREPAAVRADRRRYMDVARERAGCADGGRCAGRATELVGSDVFAGPLPVAAVRGLLAVVQRRAAAGRPGIAKFKPLTNAVARVGLHTTAFPWRRAHTLLQWLVRPPAATDEAVRSGYAFITAGHRAVAGWSVGRYVNYVEPDRAALPRYHGPHLQRLRRVRAAADPDRVFRSPFAP